MTLLETILSIVIFAYFIWFLFYITNIPQSSDIEELETTLQEIKEEMRKLREKVNKVLNPHENVRREYEPKNHNKGE